MHMGQEKFGVAEEVPGQDKESCSGLISILSRRKAKGRRQEIGPAAAAAALGPSTLPALLSSLSPGATSGGGCDPGLPLPSVHQAKRLLWVASELHRGNTLVVFLFTTPA